MNYGQCSVRYAFAQDARIRVVEFYGFSTMDGSSKSSLINWLTTGYKFHYDPVNVNDQMLIQELHRKKIIPIQLIALVAVTIYHCLSEHSSGSSNRNDVSGTNLVDCYDDMIGHLQLISDNTPEYLELLQEWLYQKMMTKPRVVAPANFNYGALTAYARVEREVDKKQAEERREVKQKKGEEKKRAERQRKEEEEREKERKKAERKRRKGEVRRREERKKAERKEESRSKREEQKGDLEEDDEPQSQAYLEELDKQQDQLVGSDDSPLPGLAAEEIDEVVVNEEGPAKVQLPSIEVIDVETGEEEMPNDRGSRGKGTSREVVGQQSKPGVTTRRSVRTKNKVLSGMRMIAGPGVISGPKCAIPFNLIAPVLLLGLYHSGPKITQPPLIYLLNYTLDFPSHSHSTSNPITNLKQSRPQPLMLQLLYSTWSTIHRGAPMPMFPYGALRPLLTPTSAHNSTTSRAYVDPPISVNRLSASQPLSATSKELRWGPIETHWPVDVQQISQTRLHAEAAAWAQRTHPPAPISPGSPPF
ncbi:hypothetical protein D9757_014267 [Collybiopsis confluens]|uniref:DUF6532 domain-containing protein n=1 Tax=Collybiopsis confluens TaxID=2823264 RepID=A0A8H5GDN0_9AGAR|nr:hypothetical protein D9757_014267 [Collybiopsis confluens]